MEKFLKPIVKKPRIKRHAVFDIESNEWTKFEMAGFYDGREYVFFDTLSGLLDIVLSKRNRDRIIFAHNGGRFDFLFLFDEITKRKKKVHLIVQGPRVTALKIELGDRHYVVLQDSYSLLPSSLKNLSDTFKPAHRKLEGSIDFATERVDKNNLKHRLYLEHDCRCLWEVIDTYRSQPFIRDVGFKITTASTAMAAWRTTLQSPIRVTPDHVQNFVRQSYAGGRCEIFKQVMGEGLCADANSLYPTMMLKPLPGELIGEASDVSEFGFHDITLEVPECYMPILWVKTPKLVFPTGRFRGVYFSEEISLAMRCGAKIIQYHGGYAFTARSDLFTDYITECYRLREFNPGTALDTIAKLLMNSTYGKFAEKEEKNSLIKVDPKNPDTWPDDFKPFHSEKMFHQTGLCNVLKQRRSPHMLVHIASAITAWARVHMAENIYLPRQKDIYYTDTDSAFLTHDIPTGKGLGEFKKEYLVKHAFFLLPKGYYIETPDGKIIRKLKGFSKKSLESITYELFKKGNIYSAETKLASFRTSLIRNNQYLSMVTQKKSVISEYNKRKLMPGGETRPWHIVKGELK